MFSSGIELINHTSIYNSIRSLPTKFFDQPKCNFPNVWWTWTDHCNTVASIIVICAYRYDSVVISLSPFDRWQCSVSSRESGGRVSRNETPRGSLKEGGKGREHAQTNTIKSLFPFSWLKSANIDFIPGQLPSAITRNMGRQPCGVCSWVPDCLAWSQSAATPVFPSGRNLISTNGI